MNNQQPFTYLSLGLYPKPRMREFAGNEVFAQKYHQSAHEFEQRLSKNANSERMH